MHGAHVLQTPRTPPSLPFSEDAEKGVLASILRSPTEVIAGVRDQVSKDSFYIPAHQIIYELLLELSDKNKLIGFIILRDTLKDRGQIEEIGGGQYLDDLYRFLPTAGGFRHYAKIVQEKEHLRQVILRCGDIIGLA